MAGCILLNRDLTKLCMVCNWKGNSWGLPKGKVNENEETSYAAGREVYEETGFDPSNAVTEKDKLQMISMNQPCTMHIVPNVSEDFPFVPRTRKEVSQIKFFRFSNLPEGHYNVTCFVAGLKRWIKKNKKRCAKLPDTASASPAYGDADYVEIEAGAADLNANDGACVAGHDEGTTSAVAEDGADVARADAETFGSADTSRATAANEAGAQAWSVEDMFSTNEELLGKKLSYDGNPHTFGDSQATASHVARASDFAASVARREAQAAAAVAAQAAAQAHDPGQFRSLDSIEGHAEYQQQQFVVTTPPLGSSPSAAEELMAKLTVPLATTAAADVVSPTNVFESFSFNIDDIMDALPTRAA